MENGGKALITSMKYIRHFNCHMGDEVVQIGIWYMYTFRELCTAIFTELNADCPVGVIDVYFKKERNY